MLDIIICILSYNHGKFIAKAIESVLSQKHAFNSKFFIYDDASSDSTQSIIQDYKNKHPDEIEIILSPENQGINAAIIKMIELAGGKSKYLAILEGDDYWTYPEKLQKQIEFLENNPDYAACFHDAVIVSSCGESGSDETAGIQSHRESKTYSQFNRYRNDIYCWDLFQRLIIPTASLVFRNGDYSGFVKNFSRVNLSLNWAFQLYLIRNSRFRYFNETWSVYNDHPQGFSKKYEYNEFKLSNIEILKLLKKHKYYKRYDINLNKAITEEYRHILYNPATIKLPLRKRAFFLSAYLLCSLFFLVTEKLYLIKKLKII